MVSFTLTSEPQRLYHNETKKEYSFYCGYIELDPSSGAFCYNDVDLGLWEVTEQNVELICACDKNHYLLKNLITQNGISEDTSKELSEFVEILYLCLDIPSLATAERIKTNLTLLNQFNLALESVLNNEFHDWAGLLLNAFQIGTIYRRDSMSLQKKELDKKNIALQMKDLGSWFIKVFKAIPEDYTGGPDGPWATVYEEYAEDCRNNQSQGETITISTFRNRFFLWLPRYVKQCLYQEYCTFHQLPGKDHETGDLIVYSIPDEELRDLIETLETTTSKTADIRRLLRWTKNYRELIFRD